MLKLAAFGKAWIMSQNVLENLKRVITKHKSYAVLSQAIDDPAENLLHVRFLPMRSMRDLVRSRKRMQPISTDLLYKRGYTFWNSEPSDFSCYARGMSLYQSDIEEAVSRHKHFSDLGLDQMANEIKKSIDQLEETAKTSQYFGFNKISLTSAAVILAKQSGYNYYASRPDSFDSDKIIVDTENFKYRFFANGGLFDDSHVGALEFSPRIYTYTELEPYVSTEISKLIDYLEQFPEAQGHPLFDHYRVLVPGTDYPQMSQNPPFNFRLPDGNLFSCAQWQKTQMRLDAELLHQKEIVGILIGEKDGDCYFISYF
jgi:hypothetical protein